VQDPDANDYVHWAVFHIAPQTRGFEEGQPGWKGPCPPKGDKPHHYVFALYALDADVDSAGAISGHALARGTLTGRFSR
jgi:phosphatidylethanolamine-binding protein (PEBP) family uncharacterized protein